jgi:hypothetical protein
VSRLHVISGLFRVAGLRRRALRAQAPPGIASQYDRLDRLRQLDPFPPEGLGFRTRLARCWRDLDRLAGSRRARELDLETAIAAVDQVEEAILYWRGPTMRAGRRA